MCCLFGFIDYNHNLSEKQKNVLSKDNISFTTDWNKDGKNVDKAAVYIKKQSVYDGVIVNTCEYI